MLVGRMEHHLSMICGGRFRGCALVRSVGMGGGWMQPASKAKQATDLGWKGGMI